jgi:anti-anti-sigma factor
MQQTFNRPHLTPSSGLSRSDGSSFPIDHRNHAVRLSVAGELDIATVDSLTAATSAALRLPLRVLVLDLNGVTFCGVAGAGALVEIYCNAMRNGTRLVLTNIRPHVRQILDIVGVGAVIPIVPTRKPTRRRAGSKTATPQQRSTPRDGLEPNHSQPVPPETPPRTARANVFAEQFVGSARAALMAATDEPTRQRVHR